MAWRGVESCGSSLVLLCSLGGTKTKAKIENDVEASGIELAKAASLDPYIDRGYYALNANDTLLTTVVFRLYIYRFNHSKSDARQPGLCPVRVPCRMRPQIRREISFRAQNFPMHPCMNL
jgi:hypothetical protein